MGRFTNYEDEFARAEAHERELQRQLGIDDGESSARPTASGGFTNHTGYTANTGFNNFNSYNSFNNPANNGFVMQPARPAFTNNTPVGFVPRPNVARRAFKAMSVIFFVITFFLIGMMLLIVYAMRSEYERCTEQTTATVVNNVKSSNNNSTIFYPVFEYEVNGQIYKVKSNSGHSPARYEIGDTVTIHYDPANPEKTYADKDDGIVLSVMIPICSFFVLIAILFAVLSVKMKHKMRDMMV